MTDLHAFLGKLRRPKILIRAARLGACKYKRDRDLKRLTHAARLPNHRRAVENLLSQENELEQTRKAGDAAYSVSRHVDVLTALIAEATLLPRLKSV